MDGLGAVFLILRRSAVRAVLVGLPFIGVVAFSQNAGEVRYSGGVVEFYNGSSWVSTDQGTTGVACSTAGSIRYNTAQSRAEFCNGAFWRSMSTANSTAGSGNAGQMRYSSGMLQFHNGSVWKHTSTASAPSLLHHWKLDETSGTTAADSVGSLNGTLNNGPSWSSLTGVYFGALDFAGDDDYVSVPNTGNVFATAPFTWSVWMKLDTLPSVKGSTEYVLRGPEISSAPWEVVIVYVGTNDKIMFGINGSGDFAFMEADSAVSAGQWYHIAVTVDASFNGKLYVNGVQQASNGSTSDLATPDGSMHFGSAGGSFPFDGQLDDVRFYNYAMTNSQVTELYTGLVGHWKLDSSSGTTALDETGNLNGTLTNGPTWDSSGGAIGGALSFDGTDDRVVLPDSTEWTLSNGKKFTMSGWVYFTSRPDHWPSLFQTPSNNYGFQLTTDTAGSQYIKLDWWNGTTDYYSPAQYLPSHSWHHVAITVQIGVTNGSSWYLNGESLGSFTAPSYSHDPTAMYISGESLVDNTVMNGKFDDVRFHNRALAASEIAAIYNARTVPTPAYVQQTGLTLGATAASHTASFSTLPSAGNTVLVYVSTWLNAAHDVPATAVTDNNGNTYLQACKITGAGGTDRYVTGVYYARSVSASTSPFTVTVTPSSSSEMMLRAVEYSGLHPTRPLDVLATGSAVGTTTSSGTTATTTHANEVVSTAMDLHTGDAITITTPTGYTDRGKGQGPGTYLRAGFADKIVSSTGTQSASFTVSSSYSSFGCIATFSPALASNTCQGGRESGGYCYYQGAGNEDCDQVCSSHGKTCDLTGTQAASVSNATCQSSLAAIGRLPGTPATGNYTYGCSITSTDTVRRHTTSTSVTCAGKNASYQRVCACN